MYAVTLCGYWESSNEKLVMHQISRTYIFDENFNELFMKFNRAGEVDGSES